MPCIRIPLGQDIPKDPKTGLEQTGSHNPIDCGCPICPALYYCENGNCDSECADDSTANMPCDLAALDSCTGKTSYPSEADCVQACVTIPPCCADPANCTQRIQYFDIKADAETFCSNIHAAMPETIEFEGIGGYCEVRKAVQGGVVKWASAYCLPVNHPGCLCSYTCEDVVDGVGTWTLSGCERGMCEGGTLSPPPPEAICDEAGKFGTGSCSDCPDACQCPDCPSPVLPLTVYRTGGFAFPPNNAAGCGSVQIGQITTKNGAGASVEVSWPEPGIDTGANYNSVETQVKDACGRCVFSAHLANNSNQRATITVNYGDCAVDFPFANGPPWCNNPMC